MALLDELNPRQQEAVLATEGPVLVLAGAGSGKTRVITYRIAHLLAEGAAGGTILAVTFTNKAAEEMRERAQRLASRAGGDASGVWLLTFHSFCARLLRREAPRLGLRRDFAIYDEDDQVAAVKLALAQLGREERSFTPRALLERISRAKNTGRTPEQLAAEAQDARDREVAEVFAAYQKQLARAGALDFDDLLLRAVELLERFPEACAAWQQRFRYIQVDEYQDTNRAQYDLLRLLAGREGNLCVVGDEDQAIYGWRGADVGNILRFHEDFPGARVIRLEENYRSTQNILDAAAAVVARNAHRLGKQLTATRGAGANLRYFEARDAAGEATFVTGEVQRLLNARREARIALFYRTKAQSRAFEEALTRAGQRYRVVGASSFYQRAEVKDALAYLRLVLNPDDDVALLRVVNTPPRGIGQTTVERLRRRAAEAGGSLWQALAALLEDAGAVRSLAPLRGFFELIEDLRRDSAELSPAGLLRQVLERTGYVDLLEQQRTPEARGRAENLRELVNALAELDERGESFEEFLDRAALVSDADEYDAGAAVTLMTLHSAKGLEFDHVFLCGLEEGLFPHSRSLDSADALEEERRLCYVGMTRAKDTLTVSRAVYRRIYGGERLEGSLPSRFLAEIPGELVETVEGSLAEAGETRRYEPDDEFAAFRRPRYPRRAGGGAAPGRARAHSLVGVRVRHPSYGVGTIIGVEGEGDDRKLTVSFLDYGTKKLLERYAHLERA